jgi:hypothetical protein
LYASYHGRSFVGVLLGFLARFDEHPLLVIRRVRAGALVGMRIVRPRHARVIPAGRELQRMELRRRKAALEHREHLLAGSRGEGHAGNIYPPRAGFLDEPDTAGLVLRHLDVMRHVSARADLAMLLAAAIHDEAIHGLVANCMAGWRRSRRRRQARRAAERSLGLCLSVRARPIPKFPVEGLAVFNTAAQELWPVGHGKVPRDWLWQQTPKLRMMPAQIVTTAVTVSANTRAQLHHLSN